ncbi:hypothetical protein ACJQWK_06648 [Exserohilum turcicum]
MSLKYLALALAAVAAASPFEELALEARQEAYKACKPQGATTQTPPAVGTGLSSLYTSLLASVSGISFKAKRSLGDHALAERAEGFACHPNLDCVNVANLNIPMCYDKFTTNFQFPDGSYGTIHTGNYTSGGTQINLITGDYTKDGQPGNIYSNNQSDKPNTSTMSIPPQFTGTGVGSAIPATELGSIVIITTTIPAVTYTAPTTIAASTMAATVSGQEIKTTVPGTTISAPTTVPAKTEVMTITNTAAPKSTGAAAHVSVDTTRSFGMTVLGALLYIFM